MFEQREDKVDKESRSRLIMVGSAVAVLVVIILVIVAGSRSSRQAPGEIDMAKPGSADFEAYAPHIEIDMSGKNDKLTAQNLLGNYVGMLKARVRNNGDRTLIGLQLRAVAVGLDGQIKNERVITPVPRVTETLGPGETLPIEVQLDRIPNPDLLQSMSIGLHAFKLK